MNLHLIMFSFHGFSFISHFEMVAHSYPTDYEMIVDEEFLVILRLVSISVFYNGKVSLIFIVINKIAEKVTFEMD